MLKTIIKAMLVIALVTALGLGGVFLYQRYYDAPIEAPTEDPVVREVFLFNGTIEPICYENEKLTTLLQISEASNSTEPAYIIQQTNHLGYKCSMILSGNFSSTKID